jgi:Na+-driven multidrug efflux pump
MLTEGFGDAGEIRTGLHLGAAQPATARISAYKSMLVAVICATIFTSLLWILGEDLATWLTPDPTLQGLIIDVLPLMGIGNIALTSGSVSWALVGAQGRYRLATLVAFSRVGALPYRCQQSLSTGSTLTCRVPCRPS